MKAELLTELRWYETNVNVGRGRIVGITRILLRAGYLALTWTGVYTWTLALSAEGRRVLSLELNAIGEDCRALAFVRTRRE